MCCCEPQSNLEWRGSAVITRRRTVFNGRGRCSTTGVQYPTCRTAQVAAVQEAQVAALADNAKAVRHAAASHAVGLLGIWELARSRTAARRRRPVAERRMLTRRRGEWRPWEREDWDELAALQELGDIVSAATWRSLAVVKKCDITAAETGNSCDESATPQELGDIVGRRRRRSRGRSSFMVITGLGGTARRAWRLQKGRR